MNTEIDSNTCTNCSYEGQPSTGFTEYVKPIQTENMNSFLAPDTVSELSNAACSTLSGTPPGASPGAPEHLTEQNHSFAPGLADFTSQICGATGAVCGSIGGWLRVRPPVKMNNIEPPDMNIEPPEINVEPGAESKTLLPAVRFVKDELAECFGWLPLWRTPTLKTAFELGGKYAPHFVPMLRGGLVGCITGSVSGYVLGYLAGSIADWCNEKWSDVHGCFTGGDGVGSKSLLDPINTLKYKFAETSNGSAEYACMQYWTSQYSRNQALYENDPSYRDKIDRGYIVLGTAAGEAFLQRGSQVPSNDLAHPQYILKNTNYDLGSVALGYFLDARAALDDDYNLPGSNHQQLATCGARIDTQIKNIVQDRHNMLPILQGLIDSGYPGTTFDTWRKCIKDNLNRQFLVDSKLQNQYQAKCWRDLALIDLCRVNSGVPTATYDNTMPGGNPYSDSNANPGGSLYSSELQLALHSASELDPENPDLLQLKQLSITLHP